MPRRAKLASNAPNGSHIVTRSVRKRLSEVVEDEQSLSQKPKKQQKHTDGLEQQSLANASSHTTLSQPGSRESSSVDHHFSGILNVQLTEKDPRYAM